MRILITGALVLAGWLGLGGYWHVCQIRCLCDDSSTPQIQLVDESPAETPDEDEAALPSVPWNITDGQNLIMTFPGSTRLLQDSPDVEIDAGAEGFADSMFLAFQSYEQGTIDVIGSFAEGETTTEGFTTLGLARAYRVKQRLMAAGIPEDQIRTQSRSTSLAFNGEGIAAGGVEIELHEGMDGFAADDAMADATEVETDAPETEATASIARKTLYCDFGRSAFNPDPALEVYGPKAKAFMDANPDKTMYLTGHTDARGDLKTNMQYGRSRAAKARSFFRDQGIPLRRIKIASKGEAEPVATNETEEGRALNRRVEIIIE